MQGSVGPLRLGASLHPNQMNSRQSRQTLGSWWWFTILFVAAVFSTTVVLYLTGLEDASRKIWLVGGAFALALGAYLTVLRSRPY